MNKILNKLQETHIQTKSSFIKGKVTTSENKICLK